MSLYGKLGLASLGDYACLAELAGGQVQLAEVVGWVRTCSHQAQSSPIPSGDEVAERTLRLLTASAQRKSSLKCMELEKCGQDMLTMLRRCVSKQRPIQLTLMAFPFKVPNPAKVGPRTLPDLAELAAVLRLCQLSSRVAAYYPPGLELHLIHDGAYLADVFGVNLPEVRQYESYLQRLIVAAGAGCFVQTHDFLELLGPQHSAVQHNLTHLRGETLRWWRAERGTDEWRRCFRRTLGMMNLRDLSVSEAAFLLTQASCGSLPAEYRDLELRVHDAMLGYHLRDSILHQFDPRPHWFPDAIHATTQERSRRLALWLVRRGESRLPWHGVGLVDQKLQLRVALHTNLIDQEPYGPVFLEAESTPFFYVETSSK